MTFTGPTVSVPAAFAYRFAGVENVATNEQRLTRCYTLAAEAQLNLAMRGWDTSLVHGLLGPAGIPHAWLEFRADGKTWIFDPVMDAILPWSHARDALRYRRWVTYDPREAAAIILESEDYGPWGKWEARYDAECARIDATKAALCTPSCDGAEHIPECEWKAFYTPPIWADA